MNRKDKFFLCLLLVCFMGTAVIMAGDSITRSLEKHISFYPAESETDVEQQGNMETTESGQTAEGMQETETTEIGQQDILTSEGSHETTENSTEEKHLTFETVDKTYFDDALFIGDSRTVGIMEYAGLENARFFADSGLSVYKLDSVKLKQPDKNKVTFEEVLAEKEYGKVYLMLGMNELGYSLEGTTGKYRKTVEKIFQYQPNTILYVCANLHVTQKQSETDALYNNENINKTNEMISGFADGQTVFYIDVNELFDDENGNLSEEYTSDSAHVYGVYYIDWVDWLCTKAIIR